jgi:hypothetical protein
MGAARAPGFAAPDTPTHRQTARRLLPLSLRSKNHAQPA